MTPRLKIWESTENIHVRKGVLQGGISSPYLFLFVADEFTQAMQSCGSSEDDKPVVSTWADDITVITNSRLDAARVICK